MIANETTLHKRPNDTESNNNNQAEYLYVKQYQ